MKKFPLDSIKIGGHTWKIRLTPFTSRVYKKRLRGTCCKNTKRKDTFMFGLTTWHDSTIRLNSTLEHSVMVETLIHEILHVMLEEVKGISRLKVREEERLVQSLGFLFHTVFKDNPKLLKYISK